jgi:hypothetical protein
VGVYKWIIGVVTCRFRGLGTMYNEDWSVLVVGMCFSCDFSCIGCIYISRFVVFVHLICWKLSRRN